MCNTLRLSWSLLHWAEVIHLFNQFNLLLQRTNSAEGQGSLVDGVGKGHYLRLVSTCNR